MSLKLNLTLKLIRIESNLKQKDAATKLGISANYLCLIETGNRIPSLELLAEMANLYGWDLSAVIRKAEVLQLQYPEQEPRRAE